MQDIDLGPFLGLGLTRLEAEIYAFLLGNSPATGYAIAKGIAKPVANTYKALESLQTKAAIIIDDSKTRLCRAVPIDEFFNTLQRRIDNLKTQAKSELNNLKSSPGDNRIYQLQTVNQVISRFRTMFSACKKVVVLDFFPIIVRELRGDIIAAARRGVRITMKAYEPCKLPGVEVLVDPDGEVVLKRWPGHWANGVFDGEEYLLSFLSKDGRQVLQAVWSNNQYLSWIYFSEITLEFMAQTLQDGFNENLPADKLKKIFDRYNKALKLRDTGYKHASSFFIDDSQSKKKRGKIV